MNLPIVIIGSGFASYQLVKTIRRQDSQQAITVITADSGDDYAKPDLSHVFTKGQSAKDLIKMTADEFASSYDITLLHHSRVESIDRLQKTLLCSGESIAYGQLVLATGAKAFVPPIDGDAADRIITLNGLEEYRSAQAELASAKSVLVIGAGLIGTEIAMDLASSDRRVILTDRAEALLPGLLPDFISSQLFQSLGNQGVKIALGTQVERLQQAGDAISVTLRNGQEYSVDAVVCAAGLKPNIQLAAESALKTNRGIVVNRQLRTSTADIFALGDCAEIEGHLLPFLQPILMSANALAKTLLGQASDVALPPMMVKVKTPRLPIQLSGNTSRADANWQMDANSEGMTARAFDEEKKLIGFVVTGGHMKQAFSLLRELPPTI
ncbi:FAD-dependent pyridine nucleotide-disulphide oxidoreductase [Shewanella sediminis HAW-EB3]|uniref:FAD-dependent pyridine nucleotide-disulphide oxidoreductase n=1 Tax=Shewanella sediminis (strain HAW-EB3) TaxID=425104 RepID=A8G0N3_SHESH|nr:NADH:flavorubredoxin reductase NorW [Shewanella sediminis]ABV38656.1 FAD-dependent pyridine nucleotide-disulphide oxidoreductase [Shewanella sediminis HAW-EB3]